jgi:hypothetical protein
MNKKQTYKSFFIELGIAIYMMAFLTGCTISFQNISTHGTATDLVDQNQDATADVKPVITVPLKAI